MSGVVLANVNPPVVGDVELPIRRAAMIDLGPAGEMEAMGGTLAIWEVTNHRYWGSLVSSNNHLCKRVTASGIIPRGSFWGSLLKDFLQV